MKSILTILLFILVFSSGFCVEKAMTAGRLLHILADENKSLGVKCEAISFLPDRYPLTQEQENSFLEYLNLCDVSLVNPLYRKLRGLESKDFIAKLDDTVFKRAKEIIEKGDYSDKTINCLTDYFMYIRVINESIAPDIQKMITDLFVMAAEKSNARHVAMLCDFVSSRELSSDASCEKFVRICCENLATNPDKDSIVSMLAGLNNAKLNEFFILEKHLPLFIAMTEDKREGIPISTRQLPSRILLDNPESSSEYKKLLSENIITISESSRELLSKIIHLPPETNWQEWWKENKDSFSLRDNAFTILIQNRGDPKKVNERNQARIHFFWYHNFDFTPAALGDKYDILEKMMLDEQDSAMVRILLLNYWVKSNGEDIDESKRIYDVIRKENAPFKYMALVITPASLLNTPEYKSYLMNMLRNKEYSLACRVHAGAALSWRLREGRKEAAVAVLELMRSMGQKENPVHTMGEFESDPTLKSFLESVLAGFINRDINEAKDWNLAAWEKAISEMPED